MAVGDPSHRAFSIVCLPGQRLAHMKDPPVGPSSGSVANCALVLPPSLNSGSAAIPPISVLTQPEFRLYLKRAIPIFIGANWSKTTDYHSGNRAAGWRIHICHFKEPGAQLFQLANKVPIFSIFFPPLFDKAIYRQWAGTTQDKGREASEV